MLLLAKPTTSVLQDIIFPNGKMEWIQGRAPYHKLRDGATVCLESCFVKSAAGEGSDVMKA